MLTPIPISTKEFRDNLAEVLEQVAIGRKSFEIQKFGKTKAILKPVSKKVKKKMDLGSHSAFGIWKDRTDIPDSTKWAAELRKKQSFRLRD